MKEVKELVLWLLENKDWLFSGVGIVLVPVIYKKIKNSFSNNDNETEAENLSDPPIGHTEIKRDHHSIEVAARPAGVDSVEILARKFYQIYEDHGIKRTQIPSFIDPDFGITLNDVRTDESIINKLNDELLNWTAEKFGILRSWFDASTEDVLGGHLYQTINLYKWPTLLIDYFSTIIDKHGVHAFKDNIVVYFLKDFADFNADETKVNGTVFVIIGEKIGRTSTNTIYRYTFISPNLRWDYWKSRRDLKKIIRMVEKLRIHNVGYDITEKERRLLASLNQVPRRILEKKKSITWYPDDFDGMENDRVSSLENEDNKAYEEEFEQIDKRIAELFEEKREF